MNVKQAYRLSTHYLAMFSMIYTAAMGWVVSDPAHLKTVNDLTHGHATLLMVFNGMMMLYNLLHNPKTMRMIEAMGSAVIEQAAEQPSQHAQAQEQAPPNE